MEETTTPEAVAPTETTTAPPEATQEATTTPANWYDGVEGIDDKDKESKSLADYVKANQNLRTMIGNKGIPVPPENATDQQKADFLAAVSPYLGENALRGEVPAADGYDIPALVENAALTDERRADIQADFNALNLDNEQARGVMDLFAKQMGLDAEMIPKFNAEQRKATEEHYMTEWGADFADRIAGADKVAEDHQELIGKLEKVGLAGDPDIVKLFDTVARATAEDSMETQQVARAGAADEHKAYLAGDEYKEMMRPDTNMSVTEQLRVQAKARSLLAKSL